MVRAQIFRILVTAAMLGFLASSASAQVTDVRLSASVDRQSVSLGQNVQLTIEISFVGRTRVQFSRLTSSDWRVVSSFDSSSSFNRDSAVSRRMVLSPQRAGELVIPAIGVNLAGQMYYTEPVDVRVLNTPGTPAPTARSPIQVQINSPSRSNRTNPQQGDHPSVQLPPLTRPEAHLPATVQADQPFMTGSPAATEVYVGQPFAVDFEMFMPRSGRWRAVSTDQPAFDGFWFQSIETDLTTFRSRRVGRSPQTFESRLVARYLLAPLEPGPTEVPSFAAEAEWRRNRVAMESIAVPVNVMDLPVGAPNGFRRNNVGRYTFEVDVDYDDRRIGDTIRVNLRVEGAGLVNLATLPSLVLEGEAQVQSPVEDREQRLLTEFLVGGVKSARYALIPTAEGELVIGPMVFHYFDPWDAEYRTVRVPSETVTISGRSPNADMVLTVVEAEDETSQLLDALPEARDSGYQPLAITIHSGVFWGLLLMPPLLFFGLGLSRRLVARRESSQPQRTKRSAASKARRAMKADKSDQPGAVASALRTFLKERFDVPAFALTFDETQAAVAELGADEKTAAELASLLEECDNARYGAAEGGTSSLTERGRTILDSLEGLL